jgi:SAM-dependent methyltransferase
VISALSIYGNGLRGGAHSSPRPQARLVNGTAVPLPFERYLGPADATDEQLLDGLTGPVLDVGCGPGRHLHALAARGVFALGVDLSPVAVELAIGGGGRAIVGDIFDELPGGGTWRSALLLDGNIGIGGSPVRLLARIGALLHAGGELLVELEPPDGLTCSTHARLEGDGVASAWFPWARVAATEIAPIAGAGGFSAAEVWALSGRWFARLRRDDRRFDRAHPRSGRKGARAGSVP